MATIFILLDAFRPDYIKKAPFIEKLSHSSLSGSLIPPFGFMSTSGAIFAGLDPEESNLCYKFCLAKDPSLFNFTKGLSKFMPTDPLKPARGIGKHLISLLVRCKAQGSAVSFYGSPEMIPFGLLHHFDFGQKYRPDEDGFVPGESLFDILKRENKKYLYLGFARPRSLREYSRKLILNMVLKKRYAEDEYLIDLFKKNISRNNYDFMHLHLNSLDSLGHSFGPDSPEIEDGIKRIDGWVESLYNLLKDRFPCLNFVLASDHGMTEVKGGIDIWRIILKSKLKPGIDFIPFLDATTARFWGDSKAMDYIRDMLAEVKGGRFLTRDDIAKFRLRFKDNRYGDLFWVCDDGKVLSPNFFDETPTRGAHGYIPGSKSDSAFFLIHPHTKGVTEGRKEGGDLKDIFSSLLRRRV